LRADAAGEQVRVGFERTIGAALALGLAPDLPVACADPGWRHDPVGRRPAHHGAYPFILRVEPRRSPSYAVDAPYRPPVLLRR
jgi:hypothetical protein